MNTAHEARRQQTLLRALWRELPEESLTGWLTASVTPGLQAYRANAAAHAERALAAAYPTVQQLLGEASFAVLARAQWQTDPPQRGDLAQWGAGLPTFIADDAQLADEPYLADIARLDWAVHRAELAADAQAPQDLLLLGRAPPEHVVLRLQRGTALVASAHPVATIWLAHRSGAPDAFAPAREALAARRAETALVQRQGWHATVRALPLAEARFTQTLLRALPLADALRAGGDDFDFEAWLIAALQGGAIAAIEELP